MPLHAASIVGLRPYMKNRRLRRRVTFLRKKMGRFSKTEQRVYLFLGEGGLFYGEEFLPPTQPCWGRIMTKMLVAGIALLSKIYALGLNPVIVLRIKELLGADINNNLYLFDEF